MPGSSQERASVGSRPRFSTRVLRSRRSTAQGFSRSIRRVCLFLLIPLVSHLSGPTGWFAGWSTNLCFAAEAPASQASPLPGNHRLDDVAAGQVLLAELGCARCHAGLPTQSVATKQAPHLTEVGSRVSPEYLQRYLADPTAVHRGTTMPDVLGERSPEERQVIATALTHFLISLGNESFQIGRAHV